MWFGGVDVCECLIGYVAGCRHVGVWCVGGVWVEVWVCVRCIFVDLYVYVLGVCASVNVRLSLDEWVCMRCRCVNV